MILYVHKILVLPKVCSGPIKHVKYFLYLSHSWIFNPIHQAQSASCVLTYTQKYFYENMNRQKQQNVPVPEAPSFEQSNMNNETPSVQWFATILVGTTSRGITTKLEYCGGVSLAEKKTRAQSVFYGFNTSLLKYLKRNFSENFPKDISKRSPVSPIWNFKARCQNDKLKRVERPPTRVSVMSFFTSNKLWISKYGLFKS